MSHRIVYRVLPRDGGWLVKREDPEQPLFVHSSRDVCEQVAASLARELHDLCGQLTRVVLHHDDGRVEDEHTYGAGPQPAG